MNLLAMKFPALIAALLLSLPLRAAPPLTVPVPALSKTPTVDGRIDEWGNLKWTKVAVKPALERAERTKFGLGAEDDHNLTGSLTVELKAGVADGRIFLALRYPDNQADTEHRPWEWGGDKYIEGRLREDMFAVRFHMAGDFDRSMLTTHDYKADVWLWSAARTDPQGLAEDQVHHITTSMLENAAEYSMSESGKTIYIRKQRDTGKPSYRMLPRPRENKGAKLAPFATQEASGSVADVAAKGIWSKGYWHLEFSRVLDTGQPDDVAFKPGEKVLGQIAVFNRGYSEHKSISELLLFDFSALTVR